MVAAEVKTASKAKVARIMSLSLVRAAGTPVPLPAAAQRKAPRIYSANSRACSKAAIAPRRKRLAEAAPSKAQIPLAAMRKPEPSQDRDRKRDNPMAAFRDKRHKAQAPSSKASNRKVANNKA